MNYEIALFGIFLCLLVLGGIPSKGRRVVKKQPPRIGRPPEEPSAMKPKRKEWEMKEYVAGFLFNANGEVALVLKNKPDWQAGKYNAIGGSIEDGETPLRAMRREFKEEAGLDIDRWERLVILTDRRKWRVHFFRADIRDSGYEMNNINDVGERLEWHYIEDIPKNIITNLKWLIPMFAYENLELVEIQEK